MLQYQVGDRVRIVDEWPRYGAFQNREGLMDKYLGTVMTIERVNNYSYGYYTMEEDGQDGHRKWQWFEAAIAGLAEPDVSSDDFLQMLQ